MKGGWEGEVCSVREGGRKGGLLTSVRGGREDGQHTGACVMLFNIVSYKISPAHHR